MNPSTPCAWRSLLLLHMATVILATHNLELDAGQVLGTAALHKHDVMLLQGVALSRDEADCLSAYAKAHTAALAVGRVGLFGFTSECAQNYTLQLRTAFCRTRFCRWPLCRAPAVHLVQGGHGASGPEMGDQGYTWRDTTGRAEGGYYPSEQITVLAIQFQCSRHRSKHFIRSPFISWGTHR